MLIKNESSIPGRENERLISPLRELVRFLVKIRTGIAATYKLSAGLRRPTTSRGLPIFLGHLSLIPATESNLQPQFQTKTMVPSDRQDQRFINQRTLTL